MPIRLDRKNGRCVVRLEAEIDIRCAAELKQVLLDAIASKADLQIDMALATTVDITAMQLLCAAQRDAAKNGIGLTLTGTLPAMIGDNFREAGFEKFPLPAAEAAGLPPSADKQRVPE